MTYLLRKAETEYWREKFCESRNSKEFWKTVKDCTNINIIKKSSVVRTLKNNNNTEISDDIDKANFINSYLHLLVKICRRRTLFLMTLMY